jgi:two-component system CheB/CheR fusion protein
MNFIHTDIGRPFHHVSHNLKYQGLTEDINEVTEVLQSKEKELQTEDGNWYIMRAIPYRTKENVIDGVVVTFFDITDQKETQEQLQFALDLADNILDTVREPLIILDDDLKVIRANHAFYSMFKVREKDTTGVRIYDLGNRQWNNDELRRLLETIIPKNHSFDNFVIEHEFPHIGKRKMALNARKLTQKHGKMERILLAFEDVTDE